MHLRHLLRPAAATAAALALCLLSGTGPVSAAPPADDSLRRACTDILVGSGALTIGTDGTGALLFGLGLAAPPCRQVTYTVTVVSGAVSQTATTYTVEPDGTLDFSFTGLPVHMEGDAIVPNPVCVSATTTVGGRPQALDTAPDAGCLSIDASGTGAVQFH